MALPPDALVLARAQSRRQQAIAAQLVTLVRRLWRRLEPAAVLASWQQIAATGEAGRGAQDYVAAALAAQSATPDPAGTVSMAPLVGAASDGRDLLSLLYVPVVDALGLIQRGMPADAALVRGRHEMDRILATQVQDASRVAAGVATVNDRAARRWVRVTVPPSCSRCIILAGRIAYVSTAFERHPHCDCVNMPAAEVIDPTSPRKLFDAMSDEELAKAGWAEADVKAVRDGADIYQVTNAHRGLQSMSIAGREVKTTTVGTTRRSLAGSRLAREAGTRKVIGQRYRRTQTPRLTPEQIYADAQRYSMSRDELLRQLKRFGYIL